jgi:hypothetical protein
MSIAAKLTPQQRRVVVPIVDQDGNRCGVSHKLPEELCYVEAFVDENGTVWTPPTAYAYAMVCKARAALAALNNESKPGENR